MPGPTKIRPARQGTSARKIPVLETARLRLRAFVLADLEPASAMWAHPDVVRYVGGVPQSEADVWGKIARSYGHWALLGYGYLAVEDRDSGRFLGQVGLMEAIRDVSPSYVGTPEAGWALVPDAWGRGFASEALSALLGWADRALNVERTVCMIHEAHGASIRVAAKCGYREWARTTLGPEKSVLLERLAPPRAASS